MSLSKKNMEVLNAIIGFGEAGTMIKKADVAALAKSGHVEINEEIKNEAGEIAVRATEKGRAEVASEGGNGEVTAENGFVMASNVEIPPVTGRGRSASVYPFEKMEVNNSFFVPATEEKPEPAKSLASTVSSANARFAEERLDENGEVVMKTVKKPIYERDENGNIAKDEDGKRIVVGHEDEQKPEMVMTRKFVLRAVADGKPWGFEGIPGAGVWRVK